MKTAVIPNALENKVSGAERLHACAERATRAAVGMRRARSVTGPLRRAHPASGATWNVQVVRGKMSSKCLWHACRALSAGLLLMLLGAAMAVIGYYADTLSVDEEVRGNATVSVKDEARGFHLNNLSYAGPIVMGFGGFIVVAACVMTFEARDSAAKVPPARPQALPRPVPRRGPCAPARLDQLGVYRLPHVLPLPHSLPLAPVFRHRPPHSTNVCGRGGSRSRARFGSAPDLRGGGARAVPVTALRRPLRRYALSVDEPPHSAVRINAEETSKKVGDIHLSVDQDARASSAPLPAQASPPPSPRLLITPCPLSPTDPDPPDPETSTPDTTITIEDAEPPPAQ
ncbi:hypothetical protein MSG28_005152 [Choristoneura fumiferana]|uniref:Uncharacterized protein n=1 Tax=Choristoneura fumiferana TaxID=7141 RepID=A0ACC0JPY6_CHOFU|nr:hypothetical protein MSG28_005152 [Choristoneura fumiferana]